MVFSDFATAEVYYPNDYLIVEQNDKTKKNDSSIIFVTQLYFYHRDHLDNINLAKIIDNNYTDYNGTVSTFLINCYDNILEENMEYIIGDILEADKLDDNEKLAICLAAINKNRTDIIDLLLSKDFCLNQIVFHMDLYPIMNFDLLTYAVRRNNLETIKFMVENGADPFYNDSKPILTACDTSNIAIFDYLFERDMSYQILCQIFSHLCRKNKFNKIMVSKLFEKGFTLPNVKSFYTMLGKSNVEFIIFLQDYDLDLYSLDSLDLLLSACQNNNENLIKYLLQQGMMPSKNIIQSVFNNMSIPIIQIFLDHNVNFSVIDDNNEYDYLIERLMAHGINKDVLLNHLLGKQIQKVSGWFDIGAPPASDYA